MLCYGVFSLVVLVSSIRAECEECQSLGVKLKAYLKGEKSLSTQKELVLAKVCPVQVLSSPCNEMTAEFWPKLAPSIYDNFLHPETVCQPGAASCQVDDCDACRQRITDLVQSTVGDPAKVADFLKADICPNLKKDECEDYVAKVIPDALSKSMGELEDKTSGLCCSLTEKKLCC